jgi:diacylglycerol kinase (ATP)
MSPPAPPPYATRLGPARLLAWIDMIVIYNPAAGHRRVHRLWRVLDILSGNGVQVQLLETTHPGHAIGLARQAAGAGRLVVAAGGDGTIAEVANGLAATPGARLGIIPLGTANVLARELSLPTTPHAIAHALAFGRTRPLWPGIAHGDAPDRLFVQMLGVGLDAQVVHRLPRALKRALGRGAYVLQTLRELARYDYEPIRLRIDGAPTEASSVIVTKGKLYAGQFLLAPCARPGEPGFTVALFGRTGPLAALMYAAALPLNLLPCAPGMRLLRASRVEILHGAAPAQADGDPAGCVPVSVRDAAAPIEVVVG